MSDAAIHKVTMPKWGLSMKAGKVIEWLLDEGTPVSSGVELIEVESEKIANAVEAPKSGILRRRVAGPGDVIPVAGLLGVIADASIPEDEIDAFIADFQANFVSEEAEGESAEVCPETVEVDGLELRFVKRGDGGEPAILIHGFGGDLNTWLFNHAALAEAQTVYAVELPGHGASSKNLTNDLEGGSPAMLAGIVRGFMNAVGVDAAHLVGHSLGGAIALELGLASAERVRTLTLIASAGLGREINGEYIEGFIAAARRKDLKTHLQKLFADPSLVTRQLVDDVLRYKRLDGVESALGTIAAAFCPGGEQSVVLRERLGDPGKPVLVIWGAADQIVPATHASGLPAWVETEILPGKGHMVQMEAATEVNRLVKTFWEKGA